MTDTASGQAAEDPLVNGLTLEQRVQLCMSVGEECITGEKEAEVP